MTGDPGMWLPAEQAYTAEPPPARTAEAVADEQAFLDLHGPQPQPRAYRTTVTAGAIDDYKPEGEQP